MSSHTRALLVAFLSSCAQTATRQPAPIAQESEPRTSSTEPRASYSESGYPRFGEIVAEAGDVNGDGVPDFIVGDPGGWNLEENYPPTFWIASGKDGSVLRRIVIAEPPFPSCRVDGGVDTDGDGVPDLLIAMQPHKFVKDARGEFHWNMTENGLVYLVSGRDGSTLHEIATCACERDNSDWVRFVGDIDHDGVRDVGVLDPHTGDGRGELVIYSGRSGRKLKAIPIENHCEGTSAGFVDLGDVDHDGSPDFAVLLGSEGVCHTSLRLYAGNGEGVLWERVAELPAFQANSVLSVVGDINGDGVDDLAVNLDGGVDLISGKTGEMLRRFLPHEQGTSLDGYGASLASMGDLNGDGIPDLVIADPEAGMFDGTLLANSCKDGLPLWRADGGFDEDVRHIGHQMAAIGDVDGDGIPDLVAGTSEGSAGSPGLARIVSGKDGSEIFLLRRNGDDVVPSRPRDIKPKPR